MFNKEIEVYEIFYGYVMHEGKKLVLTQHPYAAGTHEAPTYEASAISQDGDNYKIIWPITCPNAQEDFEQYDYDNFIVS